MIDAVSEEGCYALMHSHCRACLTWKTAFVKMAASIGMLPGRRGIGGLPLGAPTFATTEPPCYRTPSAVALDIQPATRHRALACALARALARRSLRAMC